MPKRTRVSRREFLRLSAVAAGVTIMGSAAAEGQAAAPSPGAGATKAPAPQKLGAGLIGKLEGPEVITNPANFPKRLKESPQLAELVKAGKLPPVEERIGQDPLVIKPLREIGKYGGTWRRGFTGPGDWLNGYRACAGTDHLIFWDYRMKTLVPNVAKGWELSADGKTTTILLRKGMKWSDGHPFTADDFVFWFEDMYSNKELIPTPASEMFAGGKPGVLEKVDDLTVRFKFEVPYYLFPEVVAGNTLLCGHARRGSDCMGSYAPAHYLKQFHPKFVAKEELDKKIKEAKFDNWVGYFRNRNSWQLNPDLPVLTPWKISNPANRPTWIFERNPYSIWVDVEGNQLPYIDKVVFTLGENLEVINLRAIAGEYDYQERHMDVSKLPVFIQNQQKGGYSLHLDPAEYGGDYMITFNMTYEADPEISKWFNNTDFRRALAIGIDRGQINETFWLGTAIAGSFVPADTSKYNPGTQYRKMWATYEPAKANAMLDKIGLAKKDSAGFRLRTDGKGRLRVEIQTLGGSFVNYTGVSEMIKEQWKKIGIDLDVKEVERTLGQNRFLANEVQLMAWTADGTEDMFTAPAYVLPHNLSVPTTVGGPLFVKWFQSGGTQGKEPPSRLRELIENWRKAFTVKEDERIRLGKAVWKTHAEDVYVIGVVGQGPAFNGVRVTSLKLGNVPARQYNGPSAHPPSISRPVTFFWKS